MFESSDQLRGDVLGIRCAAPIAQNKQLPAFLKAGDDSIRDPFEQGGILERSRHHALVLRELRFDRVGHDATLRFEFS